MSGVDGFTFSVPAVDVTPAALAGLDPDEQEARLTQRDRDLEDFFAGLRRASSDPGAVLRGAVLRVAPPVRRVVDNYTLTIFDAGGATEMNNAGAKTITIPVEAAEPFVVDTVLWVSRYGAGTLTIAGAVGVTIRSPGSLVAIGPRYGEGKLRYRGSDEWVLTGDLV